MRKITIMFVTAISILFMSCGNEPIESVKQQSVNDTLSLELITDSSVIDTIGVIAVEDSVMARISNLMRSTEGAQKKVKEIKVLKVENKVLKKDLVEVKEQLIIAKEEIKKLDSTITSTKKKNLLQRLVDNFKDTIK